MLNLIIRVLLVVILILGGRLLYKGGALDWLFDRQVEEVEEGWIRFVPDDGVFQVDLPDEPEKMSETFSLGDAQKSEIRHTVYSVEDRDGRVYMVRVVDYASPLLDNAKELLLQVMVELFTLSRSHQLLDWSEGAHQGYETVSFSVDNRGVTAEHYGVHVGQRIYLLSHVDTTNRYDTKRYERFIQSFWVLEKNP